MSTMAIYERMQAKGIIGPRDEHGHARPWQEWPKQVTGRDGKLVLVHSAREELALAAYSSESSADAAASDPVIAERNKLAKENAELRARLEMLGGGGTAGVTSVSLERAGTAVAATLSDLPPHAPKIALSPKAPTEGLPEGAKLGVPQVKRM